MKTKATRRFGTVLRLFLVLVILAGAGVRTPVSILADEGTPGAETTTVDPTATPTAEPTSAPTEVPATEPAATETPSPAPTETPTPEPPSPSPTATATATLAATEMATPESSSTARATAVPSPTPTATPGSQVVLAETKYTVTIHSVDLDGNHIPWTCYDVRRDAGGGTPGSLVVNVCDWQDDGIIEVQLPAGNYVLVETRRNNEVGTANNRAFTVSGNRTVTVKHQPLTTVVVTATDAVTGAVIADACFSLTAVTPVLIPIDVFACDFFDGTLDGVTTITGVDRATYTLGEHSGPFRYFTAADRQITVSTLSTPFRITVPHDRAASLIVHTEDATGAPLTGACFRLLENINGVPGGQAWYSGCDGDFGVIDGDIELVAFASGTYFLNQSSTPAGYVPAPDQLVTVTVGATAEVTVADPTGGTVVINAFDDHDQPINDICPSVYRDADGGTRGEQVPLAPCQIGDSGTDGVTKLIGLPPGNFLLVQFGAQPGYVRSADLPFSVVGSETQTLRVVNAIGGKIVITTVDSTDASHILPGSCFYVFLDAGGGARGAQVAYGCDAEDGLNDGVTTLSGFAAGTYVLMQGRAAASFNLAADRTFTIALGETQNITVADQPYGKVRILKQTPGNAALPGACFIAIWGPGSQLPGYQVGNRVCDNQVGGNDGTTEIALPNGNFLLRETVAPAGYVFAADTPVTIATSGTVEVTIVDPTPSRISFTFVDVWGDPVPGFCIDLRGDSDTRGYLGIRTICDADGPNDGTVYAPGLNTATYTIYGVSGPSQYVVPAVDPISLGVMETKTVEVTLTQAAPKITVGPFLGDATQSSVTIYWETDQKTNGSVAYGLTNALGQTATDSPVKQHRIKLTGLSMDRIYAFKVTATNPNGGDSSGLFSFRTLNGLQTSRIIVTTADSGGNAIAGACFDVFTNLGGGVPGAFVSGSCDRFDQSGADGKTIITGLVPGSYVLSEFYAPPPFKLATPVAFTVDRAGQTVRKTITNTRGGVILRVIAGTNGPEVKGSCFSIYKDAGGGTFGDYVTGVCDEFDGEDGITTFSGLTAGNYVLWETYVPDGYIRAGAVQVQIARGLPEASLNYEHWPKNDTGNVLIKSIGPDGKLVPDACYALYSSDSRGTLYGFVADRCDGSDGRTDGLVYFTNVGAGTYTVVEYVAPMGFVAGKKTVITKEPNKLLSKRINQVAGGRAVIVTTLKGDTSTKLKGACYVIYRLADNQWEPMTVACDDWDGILDGITRINGVPAGTYRLYQTSTPSGYKQATYVAVTVGSTGNKAVSVRTYPR